MVWMYTGIHTYEHSKNEHVKTQTDLAYKKTIAIV
jgi:hypothetical protein